MRIVADTNILISATFWKGDSERIMRMVEKGKVTLVLSSEIIKEFIKVLRSDEILQKIRDKDLRFQLTVEKIVSLAEIVVPDERLDVVKDDPDDNSILECALAADVKYIITGDPHLLNLEWFGKIKIISPAAFVAEFQERIP